MRTIEVEMRIFEDFSALNRCDAAAALDYTLQASWPRRPALTCAATPTFVSPLNTSRPDPRLPQQTPFLPSIVVFLLLLPGFVKKVVITFPIGVSKCKGARRGRWALGDKKKTGKFEAR